MREKEEISTPLETYFRYGTHHEPLSHIIVLMYVKFPSEPFLTKSECQISQWCTRLFTIWIPITSPTASQPRLILATLLFYYYYLFFIFFCSLNRTGISHLRTLLLLFPPPGQLHTSVSHHH